MIMTATRAAIGMAATRSPNTRIPTMRKMPAARVESRVRPPDFTLIMDWPIMAQPAMPPMKPVATLAMPWPVDSRSLSERVSVMSSMSCAVSRDSSRPTNARVMAYGAMIERVSRLNGTSGSPKQGSLSGRAPMSPTVGT